MSMFYWYVESVFINTFTCFHYYNIANEDFVSYNTNLVFRSTIIYNFIGYVLDINVDKGILAGQLIQTYLNTFDNLPATHVVNAFYFSI
jgi:hypothetical protein